MSRTRKVSGKYTKGQQVFVKYTQERAEEEGGEPYIGIGYFFSEKNGGWDASCTLQIPKEGGFPWEFESGIFPYGCISVDPFLT